MNLHIGGEWYLESDSLNLILRQKYISKQKGKSFGKEVTADRGYYQNVENVLDSVLNKGIMQSDAESLIDLKNDVADIREFIQAFCKDREMGFKDLRKENETLKKLGFGDCELCEKIRT